MFPRQNFRSRIKLSIMITNPTLRLSILALVSPRSQVNLSKLDAFKLFTGTRCLAQIIGSSGHQGILALTPNF